MRCHGSPRARSGVVVPRVRHDASAMRGGEGRGKAEGEGKGRETFPGRGKGRVPGEYNTRIGIPRTTIDSVQRPQSLRSARHAENPWEMNGPGGGTTRSHWTWDTF